MQRIRADAGSIPTMDSLTQFVLGASVAALAVPARHRRAALAVGAVLGTLPDLDVLPLALIGDPIARMTWHRSFSHSLLVLLPLAGLLWYALKRKWAPVAEEPRRWLLAIVLALGTHPLLDAHTVYGTQILWPLPLAPTMWSTVFIIDPLYSLPLLAGALVAAFARSPTRARRWLLSGLLLSTTYLGWTWIAKTLVERQFDTALAAAGWQHAPRFSVPMPFTSFVWRTVAMTPGGYVDGVTTPWREMLRLRAYTVDPVPGDWAMAHSPAAQRLRWFSRGFVRADDDEGRLVLSDLRMGLEPDYFFRFAVARRRGEHWHAMPTIQLARGETSWRRLQQAWTVPRE